MKNSLNTYYAENINIYIYNIISDTYNNTFQLAALKVFSQLGKFIEKHEKLNKNNVYELPNDIVGKINTSKFKSTFFQKMTNFFQKIFLVLGFRV